MISVASIAVYCLVILTVSSIEFDEETSLKYTYFGFSGYCPDQAVKDWTCYFCERVNPGFKFMDFVFDDISELRGYVGYLEANKTIVVAFRGSSNLPNWIDDFDFVLVDFPPFNGTKVHEGFYFAWKRVQAQVYGLVDKILATSCPSCVNVMTGGHSLGAAISGFAAIEIALDYKNVTVGMNNIGMPRDPTFAAAFAATVPNSQRMVHQRDIVPHLPTIDLGYHHVPTEIWDLSNNTKLGQVYIICNDSGEDPHCSDSVPLIEWDPFQHMTYMGIDGDCPY